MSERVILVAFSTIHASVLHWEVQQSLKALGFPLPTQAELFEALHGSIPGSPPRLKQLTMYEFLNNKAPGMEQHDVIEVVDSCHDEDGEESVSVEIVD